MATMTAPGMIEPGTLYRQDEICKRLGWGRRAWDAARHRGLDKLLLRSGKRNYLKGSDLIAWMSADNSNNTPTE